MIIRLLCGIAIAWILGKLVAKMKLPAILGWLIAGMFLGPHGVQIINQEMMDATSFQNFIHVLECCVGLMIGTEIIWRTIKKSGKQIVITTISESLGTFFVVSITFSVIFYFMNIPFYLAVVFGSIALATAPAPSLSIVREFKTDGPVTRTLIPMAALDDIVGVIVFFTVISLVSIQVSAVAMPIWLIVMTPILPLILGALVGIIAGLCLKHNQNPKLSLPILIIFIFISAATGFIANALIGEPIINFMLIGMAFSTAFANIISQKQLDQVMYAFNPILGISLIIVILNLGAPLDYHLITGAGLFTFIYILSRAVGKYGGAYLGGVICKSSSTLKKYLGFTLLPHSGVSLVFTGIAVSTLIDRAPAEAKILQGTIAAAAIINEVIAVILAKKGLTWANELNHQKSRP